MDFHKNDPRILGMAVAFHDWQVISSLASPAHRRILEAREKQAEIPAWEQRNCIYLSIYPYQFSPFIALSPGGFIKTLCPGRLTVGPRHQYSEAPLAILIGNRGCGSQLYTHSPLKKRRVLIICLKSKYVSLKFCYQHLLIIAYFGRNTDKFQREDIREVKMYDQFRKWEAAQSPARPVVLQTHS